MPRVIHFEIPVNDADRAVAFYQKVFGWKIEKWSGPMEYWMVNTGDEKAPGINGGIMKRGNVQTTTNTLGVDGFRFDVASVLGNTCQHGCYNFNRDDPNTALNRIVRELTVRSVNGGSGVNLIA